MNILAPIDDIDATAAISALSELKVHAPHHDAIAERFWQQQQQRQQQGGSAAHPQDALSDERPLLGAPAHAVPNAVISQADTLELEGGTAIENPFTSLIEHQMHVHLSVEADPSAGDEK